MARKEKVNGALLWKGVTEEDFINESDNIIDEDTGDFDKEAMIYFSQNVNLMRHLPRVADSLKPVERRGLKALYDLKSFPGSRTRKSGVVVGDTTTYHPHGDGSIYGTLVKMAQPFTNPVPLIEGVGNFGNDAHPDGYAAMRYTEMTMSKYAKDCFFSDYDDDCIEKIFNSSRDEDEPMALPCKYPNILINGGFGIATGNAFCIPPYSIPDVVKLTKRLLKDPDDPNIYIMPDMPTGCDIVDNGSLREICDTGNGTLKLRAKITIEENPKKKNVWILRVHNLPWMTSLDSITDALTKHTKDGSLPIKDLQDHSYPVMAKSPNGTMVTRKIIKFDIIISKAHDPNQIIRKLYKLTQLEKSISINFKVVADALSVDMLNMRDLILTWIDIRREYLRRLVNKKISKLTSEEAFLSIMVELTSKDNLQKTLKIIRSHSKDEAMKALMNNRIGLDIDSYKADRIIRSPLGLFSKESNKKFRDELKVVRNDLKENKKKTTSSKYFDEKILADLDDLMKYHIEKRSRIVADETDVEIPDTDHFVVITKLGMVKKLPFREDVMERRKSPTLGIFKNQDYPIFATKINNHDSLMLFDNFGKYSCVPIHTIENTEPSQYGSRVFDISKLNGEIVSAVEFCGMDLQRFIDDTLKKQLSVVSLTKNGYLKKTSLQEYTTSRNQKGVRSMKVREDDQLVASAIVAESKKDPAHILIYTEKGNFAYIDSANIADQSKNSSGLLSITLDPDDACVGFCNIGANDTHLIVITEKGCMKRCELGYLGKPGKRKMSSYIATLDETDKVYYVQAIKEKGSVTVCTRTTYQRFDLQDIPVRTRKAKCVKKVPVPLGNNIISVTITEP